MTKTKDSTTGERERIIAAIVKSTRLKNGHQVVDLSSAADAILSRPSRMAASSEGWVLVPAEITPEMAQKLESNFADCVAPSEVHRANWAASYRAMLAARPDAGRGVEPVGWLLRHTAEAYGGGCSPGKWAFQETAPNVHPGEAWRWEVKPVYDHPASTPPVAVPVSEELMKALAGFDDDYMTSETHHPGYVLIPTAKFEEIQAALKAGGSEDVG